eukprot:CAMPEP_0173161074 /NCGR_PEP_ID=MMETSP1105-20130129/18361_1 /TAXON_ID=2985 /ORGANISM="Ochromonas sp., Strain BG-1" /LENGTH=934 /DNA_ID=CAMNT_0014080375 /DNA_START=3698 /DNA_END=6499 /DNA_ORIENTATION=-
MSVYQNIIGIKRDTFLSNINAQKAFIETVRSGLKIPTALVHFINVTDFRSSTTASNVAPSFGSLHNASGVSVYYNLSFFTTDIAPFATKPDAFTAVQVRLSINIYVGNFTLTLQEISKQNNVTQLKSAQALYSGLAFSQGYTWRLVHSAFPTGLPTSQPSCQPSSQPSTQPTSSPSLTHVTRFKERLQKELDTRFNSKEQRQTRNIYFEMIADKQQFFGGKNTWNNFIQDIFKPSSSVNFPTTVALVTVNSTDSVSKELTCGEKDKAQDIMNAFFPPSGTFNDTPLLAFDIVCAGLSWKIAYCSSDEVTPNLCVNCNDPCENSCLQNGTLFTDFISTEYEMCDIGFGLIKLFYVELEQNQPGGNSVAIAFGSLWLVVIIFSLSTRFQKKETSVLPQQLMKEKLQQRKLLERNQSMSRITPNEGGSPTQAGSRQSIWQSIFFLPAFQESLAADGGIRHFFSSLFSHHRDLKVFFDRRKNSYYAMYTASSLVLYAFFIELFLNLRFPYDDGRCAEQNSRSSCLDIKSAFISYGREVCEWIDPSLIENVEDLGSYNHQTNCLWIYHNITVKERIQIALFTLMILIPMKTILLDKILLKRFLLPELKETEEIIISGKKNGKEGNGRKRKKMKASLISPAPRSNGNKKAKGLESVDDEEELDLWDQLNNLVRGKKVRHLDDVHGDSALMLEGNDEYYVKFEKKEEEETEEDGRGGGGGGGNNAFDPAHKAPEMVMKIMKREKIDDGLYSLDMNQLHKLPPGEYFRYRLQSEQVVNEETGEVKVKSKLLLRHYNEIQDDLFTNFIQALLSYRNESLQELQDRLAFDEAWGMKFGQFVDNTVINRELSWRLRHLLYYQYQTMSDYYYEYLALVNAQEYVERLESQHHPQTLSQRILRLFVVDLLGYRSYEGSIFLRRSYRHVTPHAPVLFLIKASALSLVW